MKKLLAVMLMLVLCLATFAGCLDSLVGNEPEEQKEPEPQEEPEKEYTFDDFVEDAKSHDPNRVTTLVNYKIGDETLYGKYVSVIDADEDTVTFTYDYDRYATVEEQAESRIVNSRGTVYYKNGLVAVTEGDQQPSVWNVVSPSGINTFLALEKGKDVVTLNETKSVATFVLSGEKIAEVLGSDLGAAGDVTLSVTVNNSYLNNVKISYLTKNGAEVLVNTSYTYGAIADETITLEKAIADVATLCLLSNPTKSVTETTMKAGSNIVLKGSATLVVGSIDGKTAAVYKKTMDQYASVKSATPTTTTSATYEYIEGLGLRTNGGEWVNNEKSPIPQAGFLSINAQAGIADASYEDGTLTFTVAAENVQAVLGDLLDGDEINADVTVSITNSAGVISHISIAYTLEFAEQETVYQDDIEVEISTDYSYDLEEIENISID